MADILNSILELIPESGEGGESHDLVYKIEDEFDRKARYGILRNVHNLSGKIAVEFGGGIFPRNDGIANLILDDEYSTLADVIRNSFTYALGNILIGIDGIFGSVSIGEGGGFVAGYSLIAINATHHYIYIEY